MRILKINGKIFNGQLLRNWTISHKINQTSSFKCEILNISNDQQVINISEIREGSNIELYDGNDKLFAGIIKTVVKSKYAEEILQLDLTITDNNEIANRRLVASSIVNKTAGWIVKNVILPVLSEDGVVEGNIEAGPVLLKVNFNYIKCSQALNYLQTCSGFNWKIDKDKKLNFTSTKSINSPFNIYDRLKFRKFKATRKYEQYRNRQYFLGGKTNTAIQEKEELVPTPDGEIRIFKTRFNLASKPIIEVFKNNIWQLVTADDIGIKNIDENKKYYFNYDTNEIEQDTSESVLLPGEKIRATYTGLKSIFILQENANEIKSRSVIEAASGKYERFDINETINNVSEAYQYTNSLIKKYGEIEDKVSFVTEENGLEVGQLINVRYDELGINDDFLIESIAIKPLGINGLEYTVSALDGTALGGWETYFKNIVESTQQTISEDENVIFMKSINDNEVIAETTSMTKRTQRYIKMGSNIYMQNDIYMGAIQRQEVNIS